MEPCLQPQLPHVPTTSWPRPRLLTYYITNLIKDLAMEKQPEQKAQVLNCSTWSFSTASSPEMEPASRRKVDAAITHTIADLCFGRSLRMAIDDVSDDEADDLDVTLEDVDNGLVGGACAGRSCSHFRRRRRRVPAGLLAGILEDDALRDRNGPEVYYTPPVIDSGYGTPKFYDANAFQPHPCTCAEGLEAPSTTHNTSPSYVTNSSHTVSRVAAIASDVRNFCKENVCSCPAMMAATNYVGEGREEPISLCKERRREIAKSLKRVRRQLFNRKSHGPSPAPMSSSQEFQTLAVL